MIINSIRMFFFLLQGEFSRLLGITKRYSLQGRDYFQDITRAHAAVGLSVTLGTATAYASLVREKQFEICEDPENIPE